MTEVCVPEDILSQPRLSGIEFRVHATTNITDRVEREDEDDPLVTDSSGSSRSVLNRYSYELQDNILHNKYIIVLYRQSLLQSFISTTMPGRKLSFKSPHELKSSEPSWWWTVCFLQLLFDFQATDLCQPFYLRLETKGQGESAVMVWKQLIVGIGRLMERFKYGSNLWVRGWLKADFFWIFPRKLLIYQGGCKRISSS